MNPTLLLVEDHDDTRNVYARLLKKHGYAVVCAKCGGEALELAKKITFDLAIVDHGLPDGNGCTFMRSLHCSYGLEGIALTANGYAADERLSREAGFRLHLTKPLNVEALYGAVESCLRSGYGKLTVPAA